ncbi:MAG: class I SAM-dependent methyltransferase [Deltaproteobacteria bacterium]|nr:MAG: class I SAM-dependent methyltransferase [Deltaproteobacteria bacterium]
MTDSRFSHLLDEVLAGYQRNPIDLLDRNDGAGEWAYLVNARRSYARTIADILDLFQGRPFDEIRILEIGAYLGVVSRVLARLGFRVTALDIPEFMANPRLAMAYSGDGIDMLSVNLEKGRIEVADHSFDCVIACETFEHFNFNPVPALREVGRILKPDAFFYLSLPNLASAHNRVSLLLGRSIHNAVDDFFAQADGRGNMLVGIHWREYTMGEAVQLLEGCGFVVRRRYFFTPHSPRWLARILYRLFPSLRENLTVIAVRRGRGTAQ